MHAGGAGDAGDAGDADAHDESLRYGQLGLSLRQLTEEKPSGAADAAADAAAAAVAAAGAAGSRPGSPAASTACSRRRCITRANSLMGVGEAGLQCAHHCEA